MKKRPFWQLSAIVALMFVGFLYGIHVMIEEASGDAMERSLRHEAAWSSSNGRAEIYSFYVSLNQYAETPDQDHQNKVEIAYEIFLGRIYMWDMAWFRQYLDKDPKLVRVFNRLKVNAESLEQLVMELKDETSARILLAKVDTLLADVDRIAIEIYQHNISESALIRSDIQNTQLQEKIFIVVLVMVSAGLLFGALLQNRSLLQANREIEAKAGELARLANHDSLTGLPNRASFDDHLKLVTRRLSDRESVAVMALDLDGFKSINDALGHAGGDALLLSVADRLTRFMAQSDQRNMVARVGGDEFLILAISRGSSLEFERLGRALLLEFERPFETDYGSLTVGVSIGIAPVAGREIGLQKAVTNSDLALIAAKREGKGTVVSFERGMRENLEARLRIENELKRARGTGQIKPFYQPQFDLETGEIVGYEALARWEHPQLGFMIPENFIPIAECNGDISWIGEEVLATACRDVQRFSRSARVAVNLSVAQLLSDRLVRKVEQVLRESGLNPARLTLEVTESLVMSDPNKVLQNLGELQRLGVSISLDDFGTGYSALSQLSRFRWDELKIDKFFVENCEADDLTLAIVDLVQSVSGKLNARLVAEGLETHRQESIFWSRGCQIGQGYLFGRPMSADAILEIYHGGSLRRLYAV
ncbi:putative bifunctional diguanylate cyclase/phosphodiesterase [Roseibium sediminis]|uniref:putative bifunctional diguanylate cyclase/phosphodiesterase n=1 Tax=Roseibium sediminis TaxID=1775174 RepID=UPI00123D29D5|nr:EAL domain-containing protein [Roseibium sediminis]